VSTTLDPRDDPVVAERPRPGPPRAYEFPAVATDRLSNGLTVLIADLPGRPLVAASVVIRGGAAQEPAAEGGSTVLAARALSEGTESYDAIELVEAAERLGASIHADAGWDALSVSVDVPADRLANAFELVAEVLLRPTFPAPEVERLRDERLNDLLQAQADPRRRAEQAFAATIYAPVSPYHRPAGGTRETVERLTPDHLRRAYARALDPRRATLIVAGDLGGQPFLPLVRQLFGGWSGSADGRAIDSPAAINTAAPARRVVHVVHRPGSVQTEIRIGHRGLPRRIPDFHAVSVMSAILGGLFNSRLNMKLREEKGYAYGASAGFDLRRGAGPFAARAAVNTEVTVAAVLDMLGELDRMRGSEVEASELAAARDFLIGVFPLRFETAGAVVGALSGLAVHELEIDELIAYRERIEAVDAAAVAAAASAHLHLEEASVVLVGDVDAFGEALEAASLGPIVIERDAIPEPPLPSELEETPGPIDRDDQEGPTAGAEEPQLPGIPDDPNEAG
jgi:predicted Zn-dependent peptidase